MISDCFCKRKKMESEKSKLLTICTIDNILKKKPNMHYFILFIHILYTSAAAAMQSVRGFSSHAKGWMFESRRDKPR